MDEPAEQRVESAVGPAADSTEQLIVFVIDQEEYAAPISDIREVVEITELTPVPDSPPFVLGIMNLRGKIVPILDLEKRLHLRREHDDKPRHVLVTDYDTNLIGVQVDHVKEVLKISKKQIQPTPSMITAKVSPEFLQGVVVFGKPGETATEPADETDTADSRVLLLLELRKIITLQELQDLQQSNDSGVAEQTNKAEASDQQQPADNEQEEPVS